MLLIGNIQAGGVDVERVRIFHHELPHPQQTRFGARFVAEFALNLVPDLGKLLVAAQLFARNLSHGLFVRHAQTQVGALAVFQPEHVVAHHGPASAGLPQFPRMNGRQVEFLPDLVHFFADDVGDLVERPLPHKKIGVNSGSQLADVACPDQEFVAGDFSVRRRFAQSRNKELRPTMHS